MPCSLALPTAFSRERPDPQQIALTAISDCYGGLFHGQLIIDASYKMPNFAIFGGTFDPVHWGHLLIAETAFDQFCLDRVIWVPTVRPSHKTPPLAAFEHRLAMIHRAIADHPAFTVSSIERQQQGTSYAIATLHALKALEPNVRWYWIIGSDAFQSLPKWRASQELAAQCIWLVAPRVLVNREAGGGREAGEAREAREARDAEGDSLHALTPHPTPLISHPSSLIPHPTPHTPHPTLLTPHPSLHWHRLQMPCVTISSSLVRQRCRDGRSIRYWVPEAVRHYIVEQVLYK